MKDAKEWMGTLAGNDFDIEKFIRQVQQDAIDTVVAEVEKPTYTVEEMEAFAEWVDNHHTVQLKTGKQLREIWSKGQSTEEVVKVIATYEFMKGAEEIKYKNKGES